jgi:hypothetical protein
MIQIPLTKYLRSFQKTYGKIFFTKTKAGQLWISNEAQGDIEGEDTDCAGMFGKTEHLDKNYIEFNDSDFFMRLPKEISQYIDLKPGAAKSLKEVLQDIKAKEEG